MITQSPTSLKISELTQGIDILEESVNSLDRELLNILLYDRTTRKNILWATTNYISYGPEFGELCEIRNVCIDESNRSYDKWGGIDDGGSEVF